MIWTISFRNFVKHWKIGLLAILGTMVATMLLVGGLSLNDSVSSYLEEKINKNFGEVDFILKDKADTIFLPKALDLERVTEFLKNYPEIKKFVAVKLASVTAKINGKYVDLFAIATTDELEKFIGKRIDGITISSDTAKSFGIDVGEEIEIITAKTTFKVKIQALGTGLLNFRGETASANGTIFPPESMFEEYGVYPLKEANAIFIASNLPVEKHAEFAQKLAKEGSVRVVAGKYRLFTSPLNKIIGYLFIGFSGFTVISSFLFVSSFFGIIVEERKRTLGVLRALGYNSLQMFSVLFIEGFMYLISSEIVGAGAGIFFGRYLLYKINSFRREDDLFAFVQDKIPFDISFRSIIIGIIIAMIVPVIILIYRSLDFARTSASVLYTGRSQEDVSPKLQKRKRITFKIVLFVIGILIILGLTSRISYSYALLVVLALLPLLLRKSVTNLVVFVYGVSILAGVYPLLGTGGARELLLRAGLILAGSIYSIFAFIPYIKSFFERIKSVPVVLALSYIDRHKMRNFTMFVIYSVTLILILISAIVPTSISEYIASKKEEGAFGYNFIIIENPIKTFFGSYKYLNDASFTAYFENLVPVQLVEASFLDKKEKYTFIVSDERIFKNLVLPNEKLMAKIKKESSQTVPDKSLYISNKIMKEIDREVTMVLKGVLPGISPKTVETLFVRDVYDPTEALLPMDGVLIWSNKKFFGAINGYVGVVRDPKKALEAQEFVTRKLDGAFYITGEIEKIYASINNLVNLSLQLFQLGFVAGFAGLAIITFRNVYARKKEIGMLKAVGAEGSVVYRMFIYEALAIVSMATVVAILASVFVVRDFSAFIEPLLQSFKIVVPVWKVLATLLGVFAITTIFVSIPANVSQKIPPSEALRVFD
ncbi:FtsX-like permease family protein [Fervidobacterium gondwanense]|uniref:ABC transporter permease n=1 Tax=Fervidobacterium gondwanense TaxID=44754 RepID=UPI003C75A836